LFLAAAVAAWGGALSAKGSNRGPGDKNRCWRVLAVAMALACFWELFGLESWLGAQARVMTRAWDLYYPRAVFQKAVVSVAILASILFCLFIRRVAISQRFLMISLALYLVISVVNLVSWHPIDNLAGLSWHRLTLVQALKLGCAAMALLGVWKAARSQIEN
jgi:hypothetical protein